MNASFVKGSQNWVVPLCVLFALVYSLFGDMLSGARILSTGDAAIAFSNITNREILRASDGGWDAGVMMGFPRGAAFPLTSLLNLFLPPIIWNNTVYACGCLLGSIVFFAMFRHGCGIWPAVCGMLVVFWTGSNLTLLSPGHNHKPYVILFFMLVLWLAALFRSQRKLPYLFLLGACAGLMFVEQPDMATLFSLCAGVYIIICISRYAKGRAMLWFRALVIVATTALLFAAEPLFSGYKHSVKGVSVVEESSAKEKWEYITQWSFPPDETIDLIAPGYTGWGSGDAEGPYWGRTGRSPGWEKTGQGFQNYRLESVYLGLIPLAFAFYALLTARRQKHGTLEIGFWGVTAIVSLMLAFGKYFPLYRLFFALPVVNNIRNPNKFLQIFQVAVGILCAYGMSLLLGNLRKEERPPYVRTAFWALCGIAFLLLAAAVSSTLSMPERVQVFSSAGWARGVAGVIVSNQSRALWHSTFMAIPLLLAFGLFAFPPKIISRNALRVGVGVLIVVVVAADAVALARHYVKAMPRSFIADNALIEAIQKNADQQRVGLLTTQGFYNILLTYMLPFHRIETFNAPSMPRLPSDYKLYLETLGKSPFILWRCSAVGLLLGPMQFSSELARNGYVPRFRFSVFPDNAGGFVIREDVNGQHALYKCNLPAPRFALIGKAIASSNLVEHGAALLSAKVLFNQVSVVYADSHDPPPDLPGMAGEVSLLTYRPGYLHLTVRSDRDCVLRFAERYDDRWRAFVDGKLAEVYLADMICQAVSIPAGEHDVALRYIPDRTLFWGQILGLFVGLGAMVGLRHGAGSARV